MHRRSLRPLGGAVLVVLVLLLTPVGGPGLARATAPHAVAGPAAAPMGSRPVTADPAAGVGGRIFQTSTVAPPGAVNSVSGLAVDAATATVYAANTNAGTVTAFGELNGTLLHTTVVANVLAGSFPFGLALDAANHSLYVSVSTRYSGIAGAAVSGWVLDLDSRTLAVTSNITFPGYPTPPFEPSFMAFDGATGQLFVENTSGGTVAAVDAAREVVRTYIDCGVMECADHGYGLLDVPAMHDLIIPTCQEQLVVVSTTNDSVGATITGPPTTIMAWSAFDSLTGMLWVENYTFNRSNGSLLKVDLATDTILTSVPGVEPRESAMVFDPAANLLVTSDVNQSEQVSTYNATTGARVASHVGSPGLAHPFKSLVVDPVRGLVLAGGPGNGTTVSFRLPGLSVGTTFDAFPAAFPGVGVDPAAGVAVLLGSAPNELWGINESSGATRYLTPISGGALPSSLAVDPSDGSAYVADAASGTVDVYSAVNGTYAAAFHPWPVGAVPGMLVAVDPVHQYLYTTDPAADSIAVLSLPGGALRGTIPTPGVVACALAADATESSAFVANCGSVGNVTEVSGPDLGRVGTVGVGPDPSVLSVNSTGTVFVLDGSGTHIALLNVTASGAFPSPGFSLTGGPARALAVDDRDGLVAATGGAAAGLAVYDVGNGTFTGVVPASAPSGAIAFDPLSGRFVAPELYAGGVDLALALAAPSAPTGLTATPGNESLRLAWGAPADPGAAPVSGYQLSVGTAPTGTGGPYYSTVPSLTVGGLTNGVPYLVRVKASSADGSGPVAPGVVATPAGVPYPPTNLTANLTDAVSATLTWVPPRVDDGAPVTGYWVNLTGGPGARNVLIGPLPSTIVTGLALGASYRFTVAAVNSAGTGSPSVAASVSTPPLTASAWTYAAIGGGAVLLVVAAVVLVRRRRRSRAGADVPGNG